MAIQEWQQRLLDEKDDLSKKVTRLIDYMMSEHFLTLPKEERHLLSEQLIHMMQYRSVLSERIQRLKVE